MQKIHLIISILPFIFFFEYVSAIAQFDTCATVPYSGESSSPSTFVGGRYKPHRTDIGGSPSSSQLDYFPVPILFIQYQGETGGNFPGDPDSVDAWPAGRAPNYLSRMIRNTRASNSSSWWDSYNGYDISDYWHEVSRGKLHVVGRAYHVLLGHTKGWYDSNGAQGKMNKDVFDYIREPEIGIDWTFFDKWKTFSPGNFSWQADSLVDMVYMVFRSGQNGYLGGAAGEASIGTIQGATNGEYILYQSGGTIVKVKGGGFQMTGSGHRTNARGDLIHSRHRLIDIGTHEHGHYLFGGGHETYGHMIAGPGVDFQLSPWEMVKIGYIQPRQVNYFNPTHLLYDFSSRGGTAGSTGEIIQIPISEDENEFFLIANRRKVSTWDRIMSGDTLAVESSYFLKNINSNYGKGLYIYHIKGGYEYGQFGDDKDMDLECADGLWNWESASLRRSPIWNSAISVPVFRRVSPSYNNDAPGTFSSLSNRDDISFSYRLQDTQRTIWHSPGSPDIFSPITRGSDRLYTNEKDYWFGLPVFGDRWDGWNVGYNEVFSPYSSPNTNNMSNQGSGIFVWFNAFESSSDEATLKLYRVGEDPELDLDSILHLTPPSRPMGIVVDYFVMSEDHIKPIITWNHNKEPDMLRANLKKRYKIWKATYTNMNYVPTPYLLWKTVEIDSGTSPSYIDSAAIGLGSSWLGMGPHHQYPIRYLVQAIDKWGDSSVRSDFGSCIGLEPGVGGSDPMGPDNLNLDPLVPTVYSIDQNYPNPFNPSTTIQYGIPEDNFVLIKVYDLLGREVMGLVNEVKKAGYYRISFNALNLPTGVYYYKINSGFFEQIRKMVLIK